MESKIMQVFYGNDCLPYKDRERQVHYPIVGNAFLGASNTTKIRFYFDYIGDSNTTWVSVAKLPNGKQGSRVLPISSDDDGNYAELELSNWYTQAKGDVYIALQGYQGGVEYSYDSETELYEIHGTPTIQTTGSIKLAINYAPIGDSADYNDEFSTYQEILAALGDKISEINGIIVVDDIIEEDASNYENGQLLWDKSGQIIYSVNDGEFVVSFEPAPTEYVETQLELKADKSTTYTKTETNSLLNAKQNILINQFNIKSINNQSLLGSGNIDIQAGGGGAWGEITGDIQDQTDLQNELQDIREVAEGKCKTWVISYADTIASAKLDCQQHSQKKFLVYNSTTKEFEDKTTELLNGDYDNVSVINSGFNSNNNTYSVGQGAIIFRDATSDIEGPISGFAYLYCYDIQILTYNEFSIGDIVLVVETDVPDRWFGKKGTPNVFYKLETSKIDLSSYATTGDLSMAQYEIEREIAPEYNPLTSYAVGDKVVYAHKLYTCTTAIETPETWDSTHWSQISVASGFVDLYKAQVISGEKTFSNTLYVLGAIKGIATISQADYDALVSGGTVDADTLYFITEN